MLSFLSCSLDLQVTVGNLTAEVLKALYSGIADEWLNLPTVGNSTTSISCENSNCLFRFHVSFIIIGKIDVFSFYPCLLFLVPFKLLFVFLLFIEKRIWNTWLVSSVLKLLKEATIAHLCHYCFTMYVYLSTNIHRPPYKHGFIKSLSIVC